MTSAEHRSRATVSHAIRSAAPYRERVSRTSPPPPQAISRDITVGGTSKPELLRLLASHNVQLNAMATQLFADARFETAPTVSTLRTWDLSVGELGFSEGASIDAIMKRAANHGLMPAPLELGPHMRLQFLDQTELPNEQTEARHQAPRGSLTIVSIPISDDDELPCGFYLRRIDGVLWLRGYKSWPGHRWNPADRMAFVERASCGQS